MPSKFKVGDKVLYTMGNGDVLTVTGYIDNGWYKLNDNRFNAIIVGHESELKAA